MIVAPAPAVAESVGVSADPEDVATPDEETFEAMRWATQLPHDACVLNLIEALPQAIIQEQVHAYRHRHATTVPEKANRNDTDKIRVSATSHYNAQMLAAQRFHMYSRDHGIVPDQRMPYGSMKAFIRDNVHSVAKQHSLQSKTILCWYK